MLSRLRTLVKEADPEVVEEWKWRGVPVWSHDGLICTGETYKNVVKMTFAKGAALKDPSRLFNSSLEGNTRRAIDFREGEKIDEEALKTLVRAAVTLNKSKPPLGRQPADREGGRRRPGAGVHRRDAGLEARPREAPRRAHRAHVPNVRKAVKWNSPFYGIEGQGWFLSFHVFTRYVKVTFFRGTSLRPVPPRSKSAASLSGGTSSFVLAPNAASLRRIPCSSSPPVFLPPPP